MKVGEEEEEEEGAVDRGPNTERIGTNRRCSTSYHCLSFRVVIFSFLYVSDLNNVSCVRGTKKKNPQKSCKQKNNKGFI